MSQKSFKLIGTLNMHQRILISISENDIPRLKQLIHIAQKNKRSISYTVNKITDVVDGIVVDSKSII